MSNMLIPSVRSYITNSARKRYMRPQEASEILEIGEEELLQIASGAGAICRLPKITLICNQKLEEYMRHLYKVPGSSKTVHKRFVRIGEGSIIYSIGRHRFIEMARAAGAVYKVNEGKGGTVLVNLEIFDEYMEQFRVEPVKMKNPLWREEG